MAREISDMLNINFIRKKETIGLLYAILCEKTFIGDKPFEVLLSNDVVYKDQNISLKKLIDCYG